jgi:hypothetical protein
MVLRISFAAIAIFLAGTAQGQTTVSDDQATIRLLVRQVSELQAKVTALEAKQSSPSTAATQAEPMPVVNEAPQTEHPELARAMEQIHEVRGIQWRGFGEFNYKALNQRVPEFDGSGFVPGSAGSFYTGDVDLLITSRITDKASFLGELVIGEGDAQSFRVSMDRLLLKYDWNEHLQASFGRYHTAIGYYNTAFHSGKWLQTAADRPFAMQFADDGGLLPTQAVGFELTGAIPSGRLGAHYRFEYGSSDTIRPELDRDGEVDENNGNHLSMGAFVRPDWAPGLQIGASYYHDRISDFDRGPSVRLGQTIVNGHLVYEGHGWEILNEGFLIRHAYEQGGPVYNMPAFYTQFAKRCGKIRPYARYQYANTNPMSVFDDVRLRRGPSLGTRYDFTDSIALKLQLDHTLRKGLPALNGVQSQLAFTF